ncbi:hypothetical protein [Bacillus sp. FJAT-45350]|uniref:hypothetical protein n=1 Tax=Bacillus sp. FJAT-45350 TaxID=2011014 RepID=UPI000BB7E528|nr:hypothetical protein [Bacillus sp. FJAT-45350]
MVTYLLVISFILHLVTFLWIITLMQRHQSPSKIDEEKIKSDIEDLLITYTTELKAENEKLANEINKWNKSIESLPQRNKFQVEKNPVQTEQMPLKEKKDEVIIPPIKKQGKKVFQAYMKEKVDEQRIENKYSDYTPPIEKIIPEKKVEETESDKIKRLSEEGLSSEHIAKKLNMGKGEVELFLKFYQ